MAPSFALWTTDRSIDQRTPRFAWTLTLCWISDAKPVFWLATVMPALLAKEPPLTVFDMSNVPAVTVFWPPAPPTAPLPTPPAPPVPPWPTPPAAPTAPPPPVALPFVAEPLLALVDAPPFVASPAVTVEDGGRVLFGLREAAVFGAIAGVVFGLVSRAKRR